MHLTKKLNDFYLIAGHFLFCALKLHKLLKLFNSVEILLQNLGGTMYLCLMQD